MEFIIHAQDIVAGPVKDLLVSFRAAAPSLTVVTPAPIVLEPNVGDVNFGSSDFGSSDFGSSVGDVNLGSSDFGSSVGDINPGSSNFANPTITGAAGAV